MAAHGGILFTLLTLMVFSWRQFLPKPPTAKILALISGVFLAGTAGYLLAFFMAQRAGMELGDALSVGVGGAMLLAIGWMTFYGWKNAIPAINMGDAACMVVPIGLFFGRCANFINGELYGHPTTLPWAVKFPSEIYAPTNGTIDPQVLSKLNPILNVPLDLIHGDDLKAQALDALSKKLMNHDPAAVQSVADILLPRHPSQLYEALLEGLLLFIICWTIGRLWRKDGMASGAFLTFYPIMRIIGEQFRVGDTPIHILGKDISKGIIYSIPMALAGAIYWGYWIQKDRRIPWVPPKIQAGEDAGGEAQTKPSKG
jgi:phosphatidylglycerol:prolipoprotein diacylglycerol transferase